MAEIITETGRKAIKKMAEVSNLTRALSLMPTPEDFALKFIGELRGIAKKINGITQRINTILDNYASIPAEFLFEGLDLILEKLKNIDAYAKHAISETSSILTSTIKTADGIVDSVNSAVSATTSAVLQVGGGLSYGTVAMGANIGLAMTGNGRREMTNAVVEDVINGDVAVGDMSGEFENRIDNSVGKIDNAADAIRDWTESSVKKSTGEINDFFNGIGEGLESANKAINQATNWANEGVDNTIGVAIEAIESAKRDIEEKIEKVKDAFHKLTKNYDESFGFLTETVTNIGNTADEKMDGEVFDAISDLSKDVVKFIENFDIAKAITGIAGVAAGAGVATLAMDLLPDVDVDKMLKRIIGGVEKRVVNKLTQLQRDKYTPGKPDILEANTDSPWQLDEDDLEIYNSKGYDEYKKDFAEINDKQRSDIFLQMQKATTIGEIRKISRENRAKMKESGNKSALKAMRKVRRDAIKARQIEKYKSFLKIELDYLRKECDAMCKSIKNEWDLMMNQYKRAIAEIKKFFTEEGSGGNESIDRCCDRINKDATQIVELCESITVEITNAVAVVPIPYAVGSCIDMPVHKILTFFKDVKIIITFLKNLINLGVDIISQMSILAKVVANGIQGIAEVLKKLMELIGIDRILKMIDFLIELFRPKMIDAKILLENSLSPVYYNETEEYEMRVESLEALLEDNKSGGTVETFKYTDDPYAVDKYRKLSFGGGYYDDDEIEELLEELEAKGEREIVAYRSPILNDAGDDFAGWIFYHAYAYDNMKKSWRDAKKRRRNRLIRKASKINKMRVGGLTGGVAQLKKNNSFGYYDNKGAYVGFSVNGFDAYYWYTKWTDDPTDCVPDFENVEITYDEEGNPSFNTIEKNVVSPVKTTSNGSLVELSDGRRVFVEGEIVKSGDYVNVDGVKYRVK